MSDRVVLYCSLAVRLFLVGKFKTNYRVLSGVNVLNCHRSVISSKSLVVDSSEIMLFKPIITQLNFLLQ